MALELVSASSQGLLARLKGAEARTDASIDPIGISSLAVLQEVLVAGMRRRSDLERPELGEVEHNIRSLWSFDPAISHVEGWTVLLALAHNPALVDRDNLIGLTHLNTLRSTCSLSCVDPREDGFVDGLNMQPGEQLLAWLTTPFRAAPEQLEEQLRWVLEHWEDLLDEGLKQRLLRTLDRFAEYHSVRSGGAAGHQGPGWGSGDDVERFTDDQDWMTRCVLIAKHTFVWLDQLSARFGRSIRHLDEIPEEALVELAERGFTALWLIGLWERSPASQNIKRRRGNHEAEASAYSLTEYVVAERLGGVGALDRLRARAQRCGLRLAADMVPNHTGLDSRWMVERPEWFVQLDHSPFPGYTFNGPDLSGDPRVCVQLEDGYWNETDAAVVFRVTDQRTGRVRFVYHGNDGTQMPWNDTAQLDHAQPAVREALIQTIVQVAKQFSVIRFDAAMTLAKQHIQRLWHPPAGEGGAIPSRATYGLSQEEFDRLCPAEFWCEVVDRIQVEAPDTLLIAEAFWMMEGYFVRNLGMHRVYNSAFMHMLRDENNAGYRGVIKEILATQPAILERFVNFMNNPDEETAADQFGTGDKYFGIATLLSTLPGLPMFGHGQLEGFREKYGMEFARAYHDESTDEGLLGYHEHVVFPLLRHRSRFGGVEFFRLYDFVTEHGEVNENVFAYSNKETVDGPPTLVIYNNSMDSTSGWLRCSVPVADGAEGTFVESLADALSIEEQTLYHWQDSGRGVSREESGASLQRHGLAVHLRGYETLVFDRIEPALEVSLDGGETEVIAPQGAVQVAADGGWVEPETEV